MASNSAYWLARALADEKRAHEIASRASEEIAKMYRRQYLQVVKRVTELKAELDAGKELTRTQLWNYSRWKALEKELQGFVNESTRMQTDAVHGALEKVFERTIGKGTKAFEDSRFLLPVRAEDVISTAWSGEHYSKRIWTNQAAIADRIRNSMEDMLVQGRGLPDLKRQLMKEFDVAYNDADRLVRTEAAYVLNRASMEKYRRAGLKKVKWSVGPEDGRECVICAARANKVYLIDSAPMIPAHPRCRCVYAGVVELSGEDVEVTGPEAEARLETMQGPKALRKIESDGILNAPANGSGASVRRIGKINNATVLERWKDIDPNVILTDERIDHIREGHAKDYDTYHSHISAAIESPDYVLEDSKNENTALFVKRVEDTNINVVVKLAYIGNSEGNLSSIMTMYCMGIKRLRRMLRNNQVLYRGIDL